MTNRYDFIIGLVREAGDRALISRDKHLEISTKNDDPRDLVTNVDVEISQFISNEIQKNYPDEAIYSEEADADVSSGSFWSVDPIDGTALFARNIPYFSVVIAYVENGAPIVGVIYNPVTCELFSFEKGRGAFVNGKQVRVSDTTDLSKSFVLIHAGRNQSLWDWGAKAYKFLLEHANKTANFGSSALDICFVGAGRLEAVLYGNLTPVDIVAAFGFLREAGGILIGKNGEEISGLSKEKQPIVAVNNREILKALSPIIS